MELIYEIDRRVPRDPDTIGTEHLWMANELLAAVFRLPDADFASNWGFLSQLLLSHAFHRSGKPLSEYQQYSQEYILEKLLERRQRLPEDMEDVAVVSIVICQELTRTCLVNKKWMKALRPLKQQLEDIGTLETGNIPEQASFVCIQMAVCYNMLGQRDSAMKYLAKSFSYLKPKNLPPHRFKAQMLALIERCILHDKLDNPPANGLPFVSSAHAFYKLLARELENLEADNPWENIVDDLEAKIKNEAAETAQRQASMQTLQTRESLDQRDKIIKIQGFIQGVLSNPDMTPKQKKQALHKVLESGGLDDEQKQLLTTILRRVLVVEALGENISFNRDPAKMRNRY